MELEEEIKIYPPIKIVESKVYKLVIQDQTGKYYYFNEDGSYDGFSMKLNILIMQKRGQLTDRIKEKSKELLGYEITQIELRLMPYIQYQMTNEQKINPNNINTDEKKILQKWRNNQHIDGGASGLKISKHFWDIICEILFLGYVDVD